MKIVFLGTPDFAVESLDALVSGGYNVVGVITSADKPAGRGRKIQQSAVKDYAVAKNIKVLQPTNLKESDFLNKLKALNADLQIIVAFRMLPEIVWNMPPKGTFNLHASLLPHYRGAAPINWAIINGEKETGVTTFFLQHEIDTGNILFQEKVSIGETETAGELHDKLMRVGSRLVIKTVKAIESGKYSLTKQEELIRGEEPKKAYKLFKETCKLDFSASTKCVYDKIRGLSPYPGAWFEMTAPNGTLLVFKVYSAQKEDQVIKGGANSVETDNKTYLAIGTGDGSVKLTEIQAAGKQRLKIEEFLRGFKFEGNWTV